MSKFNILLAEKVMQWTMDAPPGIPAGYRPAILFDRNDGRGLQTLDEMGWNPEKHLDDALVCLERACKVWEISCRIAPASKYEANKPYFCRAILDAESWWANAETLPLAMCICALRAMGVPESEIQEAMK